MTNVEPDGDITIDPAVVELWPLPAVDTDNEPLLFETGKIRPQAARAAVTPSAHCRRRGARHQLLGSAHENRANVPPLPLPPPSPAR
jgi:hypothetical protein